MSRKMKKPLRLLTEDDMKGIQITEKLSPLEKLSMVCKVALEIYNQEQEEAATKEKNNALVSHEIILDKSLENRKRKPNNNEKFLEKKRRKLHNKKLHNKEKRNKKKRTSNAVPKNIAVVSSLPEEFKNLIQEMRGVDVKLIIQKNVYKSDIKRDQNRFSVPKNKIQEDAKDFLTEAEYKKLEERTKFGSCDSIDVPLIEPSLEKSNITLRKWKLKSSDSYVLTGAWSDIKDKNKIEVDDLMQLWSFRVDGRLNFALVKDLTDDEQDHADTSQVKVELQPGAEQINEAE